MYVLNFTQKFVFIENFLVKFTSEFGISMVHFIERGYTRLTF